jgi:hypothetical protein
LEVVGVIITADGRSTLTSKYIRAVTFANAVGPERYPRSQGGL